MIKICKDAFMQIIWSIGIQELDMFNSATTQWSIGSLVSIQTSKFAINFVAMKTTMEANMELRYNLRMMGVLVDDPSYIFFDNHSVIANSIKTVSLIKKKSNAIVYHVSREAWAINVTLIFMFQQTKI
jgi:hypothetical protein